ncbi:MAG: response regulator [Spirochaetales bacterium]|nr:response regulator [Spirochaetales bacterium]
MAVQQNIVDFRNYRPAAIILIDLVKHSKRPPDEIHVIQSIFEDILTDTIQDLNINESTFNHTGDGWMCTLLGDDSARAMDFCNLALTSLQQRLEPYKQAFRAGIDYGMVHLRRTSVSGSPSHFETPDIHSARLESAAEPNEILCTQTVFEIFSPHYSDMFPGKALDVQTKDRTLKAYIVCPRPLPIVRVIVSDLLFADEERLGKLLHGTKKILIVDDEPMITELLTEVLQLYIDKDRIVVANDGEEALRLFSPGNYMAVLTDIVMPNMDGIDLSRSISAIDADVPVVMMSGYSMGDRYTSLFDAGAVLAFTKPTTRESVLRYLAFAVAFGRGNGVKSTFDPCC